MNITLYMECRELKGVPLKMKYALLTLASRAGKDYREAYPGVDTIAEDMGCGTTMVRKLLRWLEEKKLAVPKGGTKGGQARATVYLICPENWKPISEPNARRVAYEAPVNPTHADSITQRMPIDYPTHANPLPNAQCVDEGVKVVKVVEGSATTAVSKDPMERKLQRIRNYYLNAFHKGNETFSPSERRHAMATLSKLLPHVDQVEVATNVIDMAYHIFKTEPTRKKFLSDWFPLFKLGQFKSLVDQYNNMDGVPAAAELEEE